MSVRESESPFKKRSHAWIDARSMEMAEAIADKIRRDPVLLATAVEDLARWKEQQDPWPACLREWEEILGNSTLEEVLEVLVEDSEEGRRRRQSAPFTGILTHAERRAIFDKYETIGA